MEFRIPFTNITLRTADVRAPTSGGKWTGTDIGDLLSGHGKVSAEKALTIDAVYACINLYARTLASMPLVLYEKRGAKGKERALDHPLYRILHDEPNPNMSSYTFRQIMEASLKLTGNAYAWIEYDSNWRVKHLWPIQYNCIEANRSLKTGELYYDAVLYDGQYRRFRAYEMLHVPGLGFDGISGKSPIKIFAETMGLALDVKTYGRKFFKNGARPGGVLTHPNSLSEAAQKRLIKNFDSMYGGADNGGKTLVLEEGLTYQQVGIPPEEAQFLESRKFSVSEIARIYGLPPHMIGDLEHATFSNIESQDINFAKHSIMPECVNWEQELTRKLLTDEERQRYDIEFNMEGLVRGDMESRFRAYGIARQNGFYSVNDIRAKENMSNIDGGDDVMAPLNMIPANMAESYWQAKIDAERNKQAKGGVGSGK